MEVFGGENAESHYDEGLTASMRGDLAGAAKHFERAVRLDGTMSAAYHQLGKCYFRMGRTGPAVKLLERVVRERPDQVPPRLDLGSALLEVNRVEDARRHFVQILALNPESAKALLGLARADFAEGNWAGALRRAQAALSGGGSGFAVLYMVGRAAKLAGEDGLAERSLEKADDLIEKYAEMNPEQPEGHYLRGEVSFVQGNFVAALDHYRRAEDRAGQGKVYLAYGETFALLDVYAKEGLCCQRLGEIEQARRMGERILGVDPEHKLGRALREAK